MRKKGIDSNRRKDRGEKDYLYRGKERTKSHLFRNMSPIGNKAIFEEGRKQNILLKNAIITSNRGEERGNYCAMGKYEISRKHALV